MNRPKVTGGNQTVIRTIAFVLVGVNMFWAQFRVKMTRVKSPKTYLWPRAYTILLSATL